MQSIRGRAVYQICINALDPSALINDTGFELSISHGPLPYFAKNVGREEKNTRNVITTCCTLFVLHFSFFFFVKLMSLEYRGKDWRGKSRRLSHAQEGKVR